VRSSAYLARLIEGEAAARHDRTILHRIKAARFPLIKTLEASNSQGKAMFGDFRQEAMPCDSRTLIARDPISWGRKTIPDTYQNLTGLSM
jgi:hypothetical protein